jgi:hypothetical protein
MVRKFSKIEKSIASQWFIRVKGVESPSLNITDYAMFSLNGRLSLTKDPKSSSYCVEYLDGSSKPVYIQKIQGSSDTTYSEFNQALRFVFNNQVVRSS